MKKLKKIILFLVLACVALVVYVGYNYQQALGYKIPDEIAVVERATKEASLDSITNTTYYHGEEAYVVVEGINNKNEDVIVFIPDNKDGKVIVEEASKGITKEKAIAIVQATGKVTKISSARLGAEKDVPLWEITYTDDENRLTYHYLDFTNGELLKRYSVQK